MPRLPKFNEIPCHFITTTIKGKKWLFNQEKYCQIVINNLNFYRNKYKFKLLAYCILPWHLHLLLWLAEKVDIRNVMRDFKKYSAVQIIQELKKSQRYDLLRVFSLQDSIPYYKSTLGGSLLGTLESEDSRSGSQDPDLPALGSAQSSDWVQTRSEDLVIPVKSEFRPKGSTNRKFQVWLENSYDFNVYTEKKLLDKVYRL